MTFDLAKLVAKGESKTLELKRSTAELRGALHSICAFANGTGGRVVIGVKPNGQLVGQQVSDQTQHDIAAARDRFEPPIDLTVDSVVLASGLTVLVLSVAGTSDSVPFTYEGRPYERVGNTTRRMTQERYEALLLERAHSRRRWENQVADEITIKDIDRDEVVRIVEAARSTGRLVGPVGRSLPDLLDRIGVRRRGKLLRAALVLFGKTFLPDYPQCELRMARFRGVDKTEFLDQRHIRGPVFKLLEEAELFCQRHFPLPGRIEPDQLQRVDRPLIPPGAMREILVNALIHRDYTIAGGAVSLAIFDDRVEVWSAGRFPAGITPELLTRAHPSVQRNPIIAEVFHRAGLIEKWGRGTNRVAEMCRSAGVAPPEFIEVAGAAIVTLRVTIGSVQPEAESGAESGVESRVGSRVESEAESKKSAPESKESGVGSGVESRAESSMSERLLRVLADGPLSKSELARRLGMKGVSGQLHRTIASLVAGGAISLTIPAKKGSRLQQYRLRGTRVSKASTRDNDPS